MSEPTGAVQLQILPATSWAVLGLLSFEDELSGYDLKRWADQSLAFFYWSPSQSQVYGELRRLEKQNLVSSRVEQTHEARTRRLYQITTLGKAQMSAWIKSKDLDAVVLKHPVLLRVWAAHNGRKDQLVPLLNDYRKTVQEQADRAGAHALSAANTPAWEFPAIALEWSERYYRDELDRLDWLIKRLAVVDQG